MPSTRSGRRGSAMMEPGEVLGSSAASRRSVQRKGRRGDDRCRRRRRAVPPWRRPIARARRRCPRRLRARMVPEAGPRTDRIVRARAYGRKVTRDPADAPSSRCREESGDREWALRAPPPAVSHASTTSVDRPARANSIAAASPFGPAPTITASYVLLRLHTVPDLFGARCVTTHRRCPRRCSRPNRRGPALSICGGRTPYTLPVPGAGLIQIACVSGSGRSLEVPSP
jgi:hypothetical protein